MNRPDIIFIVLDTQRADRLGCYGYDRPVSPNLDAFAANSVLFSRAIAPAQWTIPSHASLFTGLYPTAHQVTQSNQSLGPDHPHLAELLQDAGYDTVGFCNNPLVGILDNGFKRGFRTFYNYGGAFPSVPSNSSRFPWPLSTLLAHYSQFLRRISYPIQNFFGQSELAFSISLNAWLTPLWSRLAHFKGQNERSVDDVVSFLDERERRPSRRPLFLFLNLMETHLPFSPKNAFVERLAPQVNHDREARAVMTAWNREAYRWAAPLPEPLGDLEAGVLSDMYDAEVAYQDDYLGRLFASLEQRERRGQTLTVIVSDHGDGLGEHGYFGHAFAAYQELLHVPLLLHWPGKLPAGQRLATPVSTRRVFHTMLDAAGGPPGQSGLDADTVRELSLQATVRGEDPEQGMAYAEVFPPLNFVRAIEHRRPELLAPFRCLSTRRVLVQGEWKLIEVDEEPDELFNLSADPAEHHDRLADMPARAATMQPALQRIRRHSEVERAELAAGEDLALDDERVLQQLRGLGYID